MNVYWNFSGVGWFEGERIRDGQKGWFPSNYVTEIQSRHVRARNLRQRYRLLQMSHEELVSQVTSQLAR